MNTSPTDPARTLQLTAFHRELNHRLAALDRGEHLDPDAVRERLRQMSASRRARAV